MDVREKHLEVSPEASDSRLICRPFLDNYSESVVETTAKAYGTIPSVPVKVGQRYGRSVKSNAKI